MKTITIILTFFMLLIANNSIYSQEQNNTANENPSSLSDKDDRAEAIESSENTNDNANNEEPPKEPAKKPAKTPKKNASEIENSGLSVKILVDDDKKGPKNDVKSEKNNVNKNVNKNVQNTYIMIDTGSKKNNTKTEVTQNNNSEPSKSTVVKVNNPVSSNDNQDNDRLGAFKYQWTVSLICGGLFNQDKDKKNINKDRPFMFGLHSEFLITEHLGVGFFGLVNLNFYHEYQDPIFEKATTVRSVGGLFGTYHFLPKQRFDFFMNFGFTSNQMTLDLDPKEQYKDTDKTKTFTEERLYISGGFGLNVFFDKYFFIGTEVMAHAQVMYPVDTLKDAPIEVKSGFEEAMLTAYFKIGYSFDFF